MNNYIDHYIKSLDSAKKLINDLSEELEETNRGVLSLAVELENAKEKYKNIFDNSHEGIFQITTDCKRFLLVNPSLVAIFGYESSEEMITGITDFPQQLLVDPAYFSNLIYKLDEAKEDAIQSELKVRRKDKKVIWVNMILYKVSDKDKGGARYYEGTIVDISERINYEHELKLSMEEKEKLLDVFGKFVPKEFLQFLNRDQLTSIKLGDQVEVKLTILFADIKSFSTISESISSKANFNLLNAFLKRVGPCVRNNGGIIDKYIGDAVMALFPGKPDNAVRAAIEMQQVIRDYNKKGNKNHRYPISFGIGMHYGNVRLGIIGDYKRLQATAISDAVNLASRIEELAKIYDAPLLISGELYNKLSGRKNLKNRKLGNVMIRGLKDPVSVYEIMDAELTLKGELKIKSKKTFEKGINKYLEGEYAKASLEFNQVLKDNPDDHAARIYLEKSARKMVDVDGKSDNFNPE